MNTTLVWNNILAYSLQVGLLVAAGAFVPALVRLRAAGARLVYWQLLLAACLLLPWVRPWHREAIVASVSVTTVITSVAAPEPAHFHIAWGTLLLYLLAAGVVVRVAWLGVGLWRLRRYRRRAWPLEGVCAHAEVLLSAEISSPVTFGWRRPVILLPERFPQLSEPMRQAILCHESLHVERRDWLFTVAEELVRAALWFHPAIWWLLAEIQLAREQAVDARVVQITRSRDPYVDALLEMAGARPELELAPAPLFLRKRHLKQRVIEIVREATMSKTRWISALAASVVFLAGACWLVTGAFPLAAEPQMSTDAAGVTVDSGGTQIVARSGVEYPAEALAKGVQGNVMAQVKLDENAAVTDASIVSGPDELRRVVLQSVLDWHFAKDAAGGTRQVSVAFVLPKEGAAGAPANAGVVRADGPASAGVGETPRRIRVSGNVEAANLISRVAPVYPPLAKQAQIQGTVVLSALIGKDGKVKDVKLVSGHPLLVPAALDAVEDWVYRPTLLNGEPVEVSTQITINFALQPDEGAERLSRMLVGSEVQAASLITQVRPHYPAEAKQAGLQGTVKLQALIGKDGTVQDLKVLSGEPALAEAAVEAVKEWVYKPTTINGEPVEVQTTIDINFTLQ